MVVVEVDQWWWWWWCKYTGPGPAHFLLPFINKTKQIEAFRSTGPESAHFQSHVINKTMHMQASQKKKAKRKAKIIGKINENLKIKE